MKKHTFLILFTPALFCSQVGINTKTPSATLDIVSKNNTNATQAMIINSNTSSAIMKVSDNGNFYFKGSLSANNVSGTDEWVLTSNGNSNSPQWVDINNTALGKYVLVAYNAYNSTTSSYINANTSERINFTNTNLVSSTVGTWNTTTKEYTVSKSGVYDVVVNTKISTQSNNSNRTSSLFLQIGTYKQGSRGENVAGSLTSSHLTTKATRYLSAGEKIYVTVSSNTNWRFDNSTININYSERTL